METTRNVKTTVKSTKRVKDRREQLVIAAIDVLLEKGFHNATVREIGAAAGLTQGTIYNYVRSKDDILYLVCEYVVNAYQDSVRKALAEVPSGKRPLDAVIRALIEVMYDHDDFIMLMYRETHALDKSSLRAILGRVEKFNQFIEQVLVESSAPEELCMNNRALAASIVTYLPTIVSLRRWLLKRQAGRDEVVDELTAFLLRGLVSPPLASRNNRSAGPCTPEAPSCQSKSQKSNS